LLNLALDRIKEVQPAAALVFHPYQGVDFDIYYRDLIGVTKSKADRAHKVIFTVDAANAPYLVTKPLHASQQILKKEPQQTTFRIDVVLNFELEKDLLAMGEAVQVITPKSLATRIQKRLKAALDHYPLTPDGPLKPFNS